MVGNDTALNGLDQREGQAELLSKAPRHARLLVHKVWVLKNTPPGGALWVEDARLFRTLLVLVFKAALAFACLFCTLLLSGAACCVASCHVAKSSKEELPVFVFITRLVEDGIFFGLIVCHDDEASARVRREIPREAAKSGVGKSSRKHRTLTSRRTGGPTSRHALMS